jgi:lysophospholipase L1-like esterase
VRFRAARHRHAHTTRHATPGLDAPPDPIDASDPMRVLALLLVVAISSLFVACADSGHPPEHPAVEATPAALRAPRVVAIGDSIMGTGAAAPRGWLKQYAAAVGASALTNLSVNGWFAYEIRDALREDPAVRAHVAAADIVVLNAGMNDFFTGRDLYGRRDPSGRAECGGHDGEECLRIMTGRFLDHWDDIIAELRQLAPEARLVVANLYHPLEAFDQHFGWADAINRHMAQMNAAVAHTPGAAVADIHFAFNGADGLDDPIAKGYILPDAIHATDLGHDVITWAVMRVAGEKATESVSRSVDAP